MEVTPIESVSTLVDQAQEVTIDMKVTLQEIYENAMDYGTPFYSVERWNSEFGEVKWNTGKFDGFYIVDGFIEVR